MSRPWTEDRARDMETLHRQFDEQQVIERSVLGTLNEAEQGIFEEHFLTCDRCLDQLEACQRLRTGLQGVAVEEVSQQQQLGRLARGVAARRRWTMFPAGLVGWSLALVLVSTALVWWRLDSDRQQLRQQLELATSPPSRTFIVPLDVSRSVSRGDGAAGQALALGPEPEWIVLTLPPPETTPASGETVFTVRLENAGGRILWQRRGVSVGNDGRIAFGLPSVGLQAGRHVVILQAEGSAAEERRFPISIQRTDR